MVRARNRNNQFYNIFFSLLANGIYFLALREMYLLEFSFLVAIPYGIGIAFGSYFGATIAMRIEKYIGAVSDVKN